MMVNAIGQKDWGRNLQFCDTPYYVHFKLGGGVNSLIVFHPFHRAKRSGIRSRREAANLA